MSNFYIGTILVIFFNFAHSKDKLTSPKVMINKKEVTSSPKEGSLDLSSEIEQSKSEGKAIGTVAAPLGAKNLDKKNSDSKNIKKKKKEKRILRVESGPTETIQVPDNMDWDHNKSDHSKQIKQLRKELDGDLSEDPDKD